MRVIYTFLFLFSMALQQTSPEISAPVAGQTLRGKVDIIGTTDIPNFASAQLDFAYASGPADSWFAIQTLSQTVANATLATWDTTFISDGDYNLRLHVLLQDGSAQDVTVTDLHVRNYTPDTPTPVVETPTQLQPALGFPTAIIMGTSQLPTPTPRATPTSLPPNPASVSREEIYGSLRRGAWTVLMLFVIFALLSRFRRT